MKKPLKTFFYYYSVALHPLFFSLAVLAALFLKPVSASALGGAGELISGVFFFVALPFALFYKALKRGEITLNLEQQEKRSRFFLPWAAAFLAGYLFYSFFNARTHAALALCFTAVNLFMFFANKRLKISWHATGLSALAAALVYSYGSTLLVLYALLILTVAIARYKLKAHTAAQLAAGALAGSVIGYASFSLTAAPSIA